MLYTLKRSWNRLFVFPRREKFILTTVLSKRQKSQGDATDFKDSRGICKSALDLLSEGILTPEEKIGVDVLVEAKDKKGRPLDLRRLDGGNKGLLELFEELQKGESQLRLRHDGQFRRYARRVRVFPHDAQRKNSLYEAARAYYGAQPKHAKKPYAVTGCIQFTELSRILLAAQREVEQELRKRFPLENFKFRPVSADPPEEHESDAYRGGWSINHDHDVDLLIEPWPEDWKDRPPIIDDTRVKVYTVSETVKEVPVVEDVEMRGLLKSVLTDSKRNAK